MNNNRLLYNVMYNMERYCTSLYCIENPYWTRRRTGFQYNTDEYNIFLQYISISARNYLSFFGKPEVNRADLSCIFSPREN